MSLKVIKFVAGGGKTTESIKYLREHKNGIYLAFNNKVVDEISKKGFLSKTIDSLFVSYLLPKLMALIPIISSKSIIKYCDTSKLRDGQKGIANIHVHPDGKIYNRSVDTGISLDVSNANLHRLSYRPSLNFIKNIFGRESLLINDQLRTELAEYLILKHPEKICHLMEIRFSYVIIDEAQDLKSFRENFAKLLPTSNLNLIVLGDDNQNINGGGQWFCNLTANTTKNQSIRCPEENCKWIRDNLNIDIYGNENQGNVQRITINNLTEYDDSRRILLYQAASGQIKEYIENWHGPKYTIKGAKGETLKEDVVIVGKTMNHKNLYTALTRTTKSAYVMPNIKNE